MKTYWVLQEKNRNLIIFFSGLGFSPIFFSHIKATETDVLFCYDYTEKNNYTILTNIINDYNYVDVICWSFGVFVFSLIENKLKNIQKVIAINGTTIPVSDKYGISKKNIAIAIKNLKNNNVIDFYKGVFMNKTLINKYLNEIKNINSWQLLNELNSIIQYKHNNDIKKSNFITHSFISKKDLIFSYKNQLGFFKNFTNSKLKLSENSSHYIFNTFKSWEEIKNTFK